MDRLIDVDDGLKDERKFMKFGDAAGNVNMSKVGKWLGMSSEIPDDEYGAGEFWIFQLRGE